MKYKSVIISSMGTKLFYEMNVFLHLDVVAIIKLTFQSLAPIASLQVSCRQTIINDENAFCSPSVGPR